MKLSNYYYQCGMELYEKRCFHEVSDVFFVVACLNTAKSPPWIALGLAAWKEHQLKEALKAFGMATLVDGYNAIPQVYSAECYEQLNQPEDQMLSLKFALEIAEADPENNFKNC